MSVPPEVESLIAAAPVSTHVATSVADRPHVAPVWYGYRDGVIYFLTGGRKLENLRRNPRVALSIESARGADVDWNVTLLGQALIVDDPERMAWAEGWIYDRYEDDGGSDTDDSEYELQPDGGSALVEITVSDAAWNIYESATHD